MLNRSEHLFRILHEQSGGSIQDQWRLCLADSEFATHYAAPEYFLEPVLRGRKPFAILSLAGDKVTAVLTGIHDGDWVRCGLSACPQIAFSRQADRPVAMRNLIAGLLQEAESAKLVDLFLWSDMAGLVDARFHRRQYEGAVVMDLTQGSEAIFRELSPTRRTDIRRVMKSGVSVGPAKTRDDISAFYAIYREWCCRKRLSAMVEEEFQDIFALTGNRRLLLAFYESKIIAGVVHRFFPGGVMEYAANNSLEAALHLRPNDLLQWRAIEWGCAEGMTKYSLGGAHPFLRKFGGKVMPTTRHRLDLSLLRRHAIGDWIVDRLAELRPLLPEAVVELGRSVRNRAEKFFAQGGKRPNRIA